MSKSRDGGYLVETRTGVKGRTFHSKDLINGKLQVFRELQHTLNKLDQAAQGAKEAIQEFSTQAMLCDPDTVNIYGFID